MSPFLGPQGMCAATGDCPGGLSESAVPPSFFWGLLGHSDAQPSLREERRWLTAAGRALLGYLGGRMPAARPNSPQLVLNEALDLAATAVRLSRASARGTS